MKKYKRIVAIMITLLCMTFMLTACKSKSFESKRHFEYHFFKEEYEEKYNQVEKTLELEQDANYKINITSTLDSGTIIMKLSYLNNDGKEIVFNMVAPNSDVVEIACGTTSTVTFTVQINDDTQGNVKVEILSDNK